MGLFLQGKTTIEHSAYLLHYAMYGGAYPHIVFTKKPQRIWGNLLYVNPGDYRKILKDLDELEGYSQSHRTASEYIRVMKKAYENNQHH